MLPSRNRVRPKKIVSSSPSVVLSSEPVLHKQPAQQKAEPKPSSAAESAKPQTTLKQNSPLSGAAQSAQSPAASAAATGYSNAENLSEQYTYVVDDNGYTWLYDTVYGQYYYYDAVQGTYIPYGTTDASNATSNYPPGSSAAAAVNAHNNANGKGKHSKKRRTVRMAGGEVWEDPTLDEWPTDDYRMYASNLGPDVTSEVLRQYFGKFQSLQRTHVVCEKSTGKSRGYGFLSFGDPDDFLAAWREFNNKYVGSRPIKLGKSNWKDRNIDIRKVKRVDKRAFLEFKHRKR